MKNYKRSKDIKAGVIGYGGTWDMGKSHMEQMQANGMVPTAVMDIDVSRLKAAKVDFPGILTFTSIPTMLKKVDLDLVTIVTPHYFHASQALQCLKAGVNVICEKPMAVTTEECDEMISTAKKKKLMLSTFHNRHWDGCILQAMKMIKQGAIGDVYRVEAHTGGRWKPANTWRSSKKLSGGILYDWGVHFLEYSLQIIDSELAEVTGYTKKGFWAPKTKWKQDTIEDECYAIARFKNGAWLSLCISTLDSNPKPGIVEITGTKGTYIMDHGNWKIIKHEKSREKIIREGRNPNSDSWKIYYKNISDHLLKRKPLIITAEWARRSIHILDLANKSSQKGCALPTKYK